MKKMKSELYLLEGVFVQFTLEKDGRPDHDKLGEFLQFMVDEKIYPETSAGGYSGQGRFGGFYSKENAEKIKAWLNENVK